MMRRRYWIPLAAIAILLVAGDLIYWQMASARLRDGLQSWIVARRAEGWEVASGAISSGGWPRSATLRVPALTLRHAGRTMPGTISWAAAEVRLTLSLYHPTALQIDLGGPQHLQLGDAPDMIITGETMALTVGMLSEETLPLSMYARGIRAEPAAGGWHLTVGLLNATAEIMPAAEQSHPLASFSMSSEAIALPAGFRWPLGANISSLSMDATLRGPLPSVQDIRQCAEAWRDGGGSLEVSHLASGWGPLGLTGGATLALDDQLQPMGSGSGRLVGYVETLNKLAAAGVMSKSAAIAAKAVLSLMAGPGEGDEPSAVDVPLTLQYRTLSMRQVPLVRLPELDWPTQ